MLIVIVLSSFFFFAVTETNAYPLFRGSHWLYLITRAIECTESFENKFVDDSGGWLYQ